jgi:hypothetical protein
LYAFGDGVGFKGVCEYSAQAGEPAVLVEVLLRSVRFSFSSFLLSVHFSRPQHTAVRRHFRPDRATQCTVLISRTSAEADYSPAYDVALHPQSSSSCASLSSSVLSKSALQHCIPLRCLAERTPTERGDEEEM